MSTIEEDLKAAEAAKAAADAGKTPEVLLKEAQDEIAKLKDKDTNFSKVREAKEIAEKKILELQGIIDSTKNEKADSDIKLKITELSKGDEDLKKVIEYHFNKNKGDAKTPEELTSKLNDAYTLATKGKPVNDIVRNQAGAGSGKPINSGVTTIDPKTKEWADEFNKHGAGIKDEDLKNPKYQVKPGQSKES